MVESEELALTRLRPPSTPPKRDTNRYSEANAVLFSANFEWRPSYSSYHFQHPFSEWTCAIAKSTQKNTQQLTIPRNKTIY